MAGTVFRNVPNNDALGGCVDLGTLRSSGMQYDDIQDTPTRPASPPPRSTERSGLVTSPWGIVHSAHESRFQPGHRNVPNSDLLERGCEIGIFYARRAAPSFSFSCIYFAAHIFTVLQTTPRIDEAIAKCRRNKS